MKKTFIALMVLSTAVNAASVGYDSMTSQQKEGVVLAWDFSDGVNTPSVGSIKDNFTLNANGTAASINEDNPHPYTTGLGELVPNGDFTLSFDLYSFKADNWQSLVALYSGDATDGAGDVRSLQIGVNSSGTLMLFNKVGGATGFADIDTTSNLSTELTSPYTGSATVTVVSDMTNTKTLTLYVNGQKVGQHASWLIQDEQGNNKKMSWVAPDGESRALKGLQFGTTFGHDDRKFPKAEIGNITLWNKALSAAEVSDLVVPEPTTATLSLLTLAALCARRRRK